MKICIWYQPTEQPWGGSNQFLRALSNELVRIGHSVSLAPTQETEVVLINAHNTAAGNYLSPNTAAQLKQTGHITSYGRLIPAKLWTLLRQKRGPVLVHRLDGVSQLYRGSRTRADGIQPAINRLSDFTIFQSRYCQESFQEYGVAPSHSRVIYNGVDSSIFYPSLEELQVDVPLRLVAVSWSMNIRKGFLALSRVSRIPGVEIRFVGRWPSTIEPANVVLAGPKISTEIAQILRQSHAMIHAAENEPCSNAILEALACGLPVLFNNSGANRELAGNYGIALTNDLPSAIERLRSDYKRLREKIISNRSRFLITSTAQRYLEVFRQVLKLRQTSLL